MSETEESERRKLPTYKEMMKMALPHLGLYTFLFFYLICGAWMFRWIEYEEDVRLQQEKFVKLRHKYQDVKTELSRMSGHIPEEQQEELQRRLHQMLVTLSDFSLSRQHEGPNFKMNINLDNDDVMPPRWDKMSAVLYALSILYCEFSHRICRSRRPEIMTLVVGKPSHKRSIRSCGSFRMRGRKKPVQPPEDSEEHSVCRQDEEVREAQETKRLPLSLNASILLVFCMLGGLMYLAAGSNKTFLEAFFVTFNLVANLTMGEMPSDLNHVLTLIYIFIFVTFGVAVLSMCAELAALELKELFLKIHYFGRKINFKRKKRNEQMEVEVKELLKIIEEIRKRYPEKEHITSLDILEYMHERGRVGSGERRDTIAFMPQTMEALKFADEGDQEDRSLSRVEELPLLDKTVDVWAFITEAELEEKLRQHSIINQKKILGRLQRQKRQSTLNSLHYPQDECVNLL